MPRIKFPLQRFFPLFFISGLRNSFSLLAGDDLEQARLELFGSCLELPGGDVILPKGLHHLLDSLVRGLPEGMLKLNRRVSLVDWSLLSRDPQLMDKVVVETMTENGEEIEEYHADYVICTLPLGVMKRCHQQIFYPALSQQKVNNFLKNNS